MSLNDVAGRMEVHASTVSRTIKGKSIQYDGGIIPIRDLFSLKAGKKSAAAESADKIKKLIRSMISQEDQRFPFSDQQLCDKLAAQDISISRRLVAKYREELEIPNTMLRKQVEK